MKRRQLLRTVLLAPLTALPLSLPSPALGTPPAASPEAKKGILEAGSEYTYAKPLKDMGIWVMVMRRSGGYDDYSLQEYRDKFNREPFGVDWVIRENNLNRLSYAQMVESHRSSSIPASPKPAAPSVN